VCILRSVSGIFINEYCTIVVHLKSCYVGLHYNGSSPVGQRVELPLNFSPLEKNWRNVKKNTKFAAGNPYFRGSLWAKLKF